MTINYLAILVSGVIAMILGALWYGPIFGKIWMQLMNFTQSDIEEAKKKGMGKSYALMFLGSLIMSYVIARLVGTLNPTTFSAGAALGFWLWLGLVTPILLSGVLWENKPWKLWWLNIAYYLVQIAVISGILTVWR
jgi:hypothetical protein